MTLNDNDSSWTALRAREAIDTIIQEWTRPCLLFKPRLFKDGNRWCALLGEDMQEGIVAFGTSPDGAMGEFDRVWMVKDEH